MPIHDWKSVDAGIFHHFHHSWIEEIQRTLNADLLPEDYYAMAEQQTGGFGPDVLTLQSKSQKRGQTPKEGQQEDASSSLQLAPPPVAFTAEAAGEFHRRRPSSISIRHISGDRVVAVVEVVSPGNKGAKGAFQAFVDKVCELIEFKINLLILDLFPPTRRDPKGIHAELWEEIADQTFEPPNDKPLTLVAYESAWSVRAFIQPVAVGEALPDMPLYLEPGGCVWVPLEKTYRAAFAAMPKRWQTVLEP